MVDYSFLSKLCLATVFASFLCLDAAASISSTGTPSTTAVTLTGPAYDLGGGGADVDEAMQWVVDQVRGGSSSSTKVDVVVLRCDSNATGYNAPWAALNGVNSCSTVYAVTAADFNSSTVATLLNKAEVVFFAGGAQCDYINYVKGTATDTAIKALVARGGGVGGSSAGCAIQGPFIYDGCLGGGAVTAEALADPYYSATISFSYNWYSWPNFDNVMCEPHFQARDRMGRIMSFLARQVKDGKTSTAYGICVDEGTSLVVDKNGLMTNLSYSSGNGFVVLLDKQPETCVSGQKLTCTGYKIWKLAPGQTYNLKTRPCTGYYVGNVNNGVVGGSYYTAGTIINTCTTPSTPVITSQPANTTVAVGATAFFSVSATSSTPMAYQWKKNAVNITSAGTSSSYTTPATVSTDNGINFSVAITNSVGTVNSTNALLTVTVQGVPTITTHPQSSTVAANTNVTLTVAATSSTTMTYKWFKNATVISGATTTSYVYTATASASFYATVTNSVGTATSNTATITVSSGGGSTYTEVESNNSVAAANDVSTKTFPLTITGTCSSTSDCDYFKVTLAAGQSLIATLTVPTTADYDLKLKSSSNSQLASSTNNGKGLSETFSYKNTGTSAVTIYPEVLGYSGSGTWTLVLKKQ